MPDWLSATENRRRGDRAADRLTRVHYRSRAVNSEPPRPKPRAADVLRDVLLAQVIPELAARRRSPEPARVPMDEFTDSLLAFDVEAAAALVIRAFGPKGQLVAVSGALFEAAARRMGDRWADDACSEADITLGLCCVGQVMRLIGGGSTGRAPGPTAWSPRVLVAAQPGEPHALGPVLHTEALYQANIAPQVVHPKDDAALLGLLATESFDCLDLSLSAVFTRKDRLLRAATTIACARVASRNPALAVIVNGRAVDGFGDIARRLGANAASRSATGIADLLRRTLAATAVPAVPRGRTRTQAGRSASCVSAPLEARSGRRRSLASG